jgi:phosphate transport system substrate-binding protein
MGGIMHSRTLIFILSCAALIILSAPAGATTPPEGGITLTWTGCGISRHAYMDDLAKLYEEQTGVKIVISGGGASKGIRDVSGGQTDIGGTCRLKLPNVAEEENATLVPVAWDALAVITHPENPVDDVNLEQLQDIFLGKITNWKELGGNDAPLRLYVRQGKNSGVGRSLRKHLFANYDQEFVAAEIFPSTGPLERAIETDVNAIGVTGVSSARKRALKLVHLEGKVPSYANIRNGDYLLYRPMYLSYNAENANAEEVKNFISFIYGNEGSKVLATNGIVPYLDGIHLIRKKIAQNRDARARGL